MSLFASAWSDIAGLFICCCMMFFMFYTAIIVHEVTHIVQADLRNDTVYEVCYFGTPEQAGNVSLAFAGWTLRDEQPDEIDLVDEQQAWIITLVWFFVWAVACIKIVDNHVLIKL